jgi:signal transduction histidine kinase
MRYLRIFLVENTSAKAETMRKKLSRIDSIRFSVTTALAKNAEDTFKDTADQVDVILFGDKVRPTRIIELTKLFRSNNMVIPIFLLTNLSEARVQRKFRNAGVDDTLNISEIDTPLFAWTFTSTVEHAVLRKKAKEYDTLNHQLQNISESLANFMHDMNNPLSVIRLAMYHLDNPQLEAEKRDTFLKILVTNVERLDAQMQDLRTIRRQLGGNKSQSAKILSLKHPLPLSAVQ